MSEAIIEIKHLKKYYGDTRGVEDVSLKLEKGDIYGFIGPNGAGKSTTIRTLMGLIHKTSGDIRVFGKEYQADDIEMKRRIGYLPGEVNLYGDMTVKELFLYHESFYHQDFSKRRNELVKLLKIDLNKTIDKLSLGNLKKVGIVLALMHEPELLILDEPTSGLDPIMQNTFHDILLKEKAKGTTILYSSHILSEVSSLCDCVGFIKDGVIIKEDSMDNIKKENYTFFYDNYDLLSGNINESISLKNKDYFNTYQYLRERSMIYFKSLDSVTYEPMCGKCYIKKVLKIDSL